MKPPAPGSFRDAWSRLEPYERVIGAFMLAAIAASIAALVLRA